MMCGYEIIDADGHVYEKDQELFDYMEDPYAGKKTLLGFPFWPTIDGFQRGAIYAHLKVHKSFETNASIWLDFLDQTGVARTVLYPTAGLTCGFIFTSDFPHEGNVERCRREIAALKSWKGLSEEEKQKILSENARRFYRLPM